MHETDAVAAVFCQVVVTDEGDAPTDTVGAVVSPGVFTVTPTLVVRVRPPPTPVMMMVKDPVWAVAFAVMVAVVEQFGVQEVGEKETLVPVPCPDAEKETDELNPFDGVAVIATVVLVP